MSESTQWAVLIPAVLLLVLGTLQGGLWLHGRNALGTAAAAIAEAEANAGSVTDAGAVGERIALRAGLVDFQSSTMRGPALVEVSVSARVPVFWDLGQGRIWVRRAVPVERLTRP